MNHKGKRLFITGIPTSGKTYLAEVVAKNIGAKVVSLDDFRETLANDPEYKQWTNFYIEKDEREYLTKTTPDDQWKNLVNQSEGLWPAFLKEISNYESEEAPVIFENVNLLPHLVKRDLSFPGIVLIGKSFEETLERNKKDPRWGTTLELQELEAKTFFEIERPRYAEEAKKYEYPVFESAEEAFDQVLKLLV